MSILVTGAGGMVGSHMVEKFYNEGIEVVGTYYKPTVNIKELNPAINMIETDIRYPDNIEKVIMNYLPEKIFHLAAQSYPTVSWEKPYETIDINVNGTIAVYEAIKKVRRFKPDYNPMVVVACSSAEYGASLEKYGDEKVPESAELLPLHPYGVSKVGQDLISYQYFKNDGIRCIRARIFNSTGPRKVNDVTSDFTKRAIELEKIGSGKWELKVGNVETYRAIMDVRDLIEALILLSDKGNAGDVYNISSETVYQIKDVIRTIEEDMNIKFNLAVDKKLLRPTDEKIIVGDVTKLKKATGWKQNIPYKKTVHDMLEYWRKTL